MGVKFCVFLRIDATVGGEKTLERGRKMPVKDIKKAGPGSPRGNDIGERVSQPALFEEKAIGEEEATPVGPSGIDGGRAAVYARVSSEQQEKEEEEAAGGEEEASADRDPSPSPPPCWTLALKPAWASTWTGRSTSSPRR